VKGSKSTKTGVKSALKIDTKTSWQTFGDKAILGLFPFFFQANKIPNNEIEALEEDKIEWHK
jgi:hypothetical protein